MSLNTQLFSVSLVLLTHGTLCAQHLHIDYSSSPVEVTEAHLEMPFTAGSDYAPSFALSSAAIARIDGFRGQETWCLQAYLLGQSALAPSISLAADLGSVDLSQVVIDGTPLSMQLESLAKPVFSGIGNVDQLFIQISIQGAQVSQHVGEVLYTVQWRMVDGGCLVP